MPYRFEHASTGRAGCKGSLCKFEGTKIAKGELRCGSFFTLPDRDSGSWAWKHWGCVTAKQISNMNDEIEGDTELLDGLGDLTPAEQEKIIVALSEGHVADEDWREEPGGNMPGAPAKRRKAMAKKAEHEEEDDEPEQTSTNGAKTSKAKRGAGNDGDDVAKPKKKRKSARDAAAAEAHEDDDQENGAEYDAPAPPAKKKGKKSSVKAPTIDGAADADDAPEPPKAKRGRKKAKSAEVIEVAEDEELEPEPKPKKKGRSRKATK